MIKNKLFLLLVCIATHAHGMDQSVEPLEITVKCVKLVQPFELSSDVLNENKKKCLQFGIEWIKRGQQLIKIKPECYDNPDIINCLIKNPRKLNQAVRDNRLTQSEVIQRMNTPQMPAFIPFEAVYGDRVSEKHTDIWHFNGTPIHITFKFEEELAPTNWNPGKECIPLSLIAKEIMFHPIMLFYEGCLIAALILYMYQR